MNKEIKEKWIKALRSGEYKQGIEALRTEDRYCCLGVLCDLAVKEGVIDPPKRDLNSYFYCDECEVLPPKISEWAEIDSSIGVFNRENHFFESLAEKNDNGASFEEIADIIEEKF